MAGWNYRVVRDLPGTDPGELTICEVYYDEKDRPNGYDRQPFLHADSIITLHEMLTQMRKGLAKPILDISDFSLDKTSPAE